VEQEKVRLEANLPLAVTMFKGTIEKRLREEVAKVLAVSPGAATG
jgi:hypothetical protein